MVLRFSYAFRDGLRLAKRLKPLRLLNFLLFKAGIWLSRLSGRVVVAGRAYSVSAEVAGICNLRCPGCMIGRGETQRNNKLMTTLTFKAIVERHRKHSFYLNLYFQGEPFLNPELQDLVSVASSNGFYTCISTNGHFLDDLRCRELIRAGLDRVVVSLDGLDQESYSFYRIGGSFQKVVLGLETLAKTRREEKRQNPLIVLQFLVNRKNEGQIGGLKEFAEQIGADVLELKSMQVYDEQGADAFLPSLAGFNRYRQWLNGKPKFLQPGTGPCGRLWSHVVYTADGVQVPCCYDKIPEHPLGTISGEDPWFSPEMNAFRKRVMVRREDTGICCNCGR